MKSKVYSCYKCVGKHSGFIKYGKTNRGKQHYQCKSCRAISVFLKKITYFCILNSWYKEAIIKKSLSTEKKQMIEY